MSLLGHRIYFEDEKTEAQKVTSFAPRSLDQEV